MHKDTTAGLAAHDAEHEQVLSILPWFVNGTLSDDERRRAQDHLSSCLVCRRELQALGALREAVASRTLEPQCEAALDRLHERLDETAGGRSVFPWAAAAVLVIVTGLTGLIAMNTGLIATYGDSDGAYLTLGTRTIAVADGEIVQARIVFDQDMTEWQLRELLLAADAELIDGPTARGAYTIAMPRVARGEDLQDAVAKLRESKRVIFVEPIVSIRPPTRAD